MQDTSNTALHSLPDGLVLKQSSICNAGLGVFTSPDCSLTKDRVFGPYAGVVVMNRVEAHASGYSWEVLLASQLNC